MANTNLSCAKRLCSSRPKPPATPYTTVLAPNVNLFSLEFYNTNTLEWDPEWPWTNQLPKLVKRRAQRRPAQSQGDPAAIRPWKLRSSAPWPSRGVLQVPAIRRGLGGVPGTSAGKSGDEDRLPQRRSGVTQRSGSAESPMIIVMIVTVVLGILAGGFAYSMKVETKLAQNSGFEGDLEWLGRSGVELGSLRPRREP